MEKRNIFRLCLLLVVGLWTFIQPAVSAPITRQKALRNVNEFLQERGVRIQETAIRHAPIKSNEQETAPYYVFNLGDDNGFVIASGDDCAYEILGYSDKGSFDADNIPENVQAWLDGYAEEIEWGRENNVSALKTAKAGPAKKSVEPMLTTQWGQNSPYNDQCVFNGVAYPTGCGATAMAQLMYYWAKIGKDGKTFRCGSTGMSPYITSTNSVQVDSIPPLVSFDWDNMTDGEPTTTKGKQAVAQLMRYCGQSISMDYDSSGSASFSNAINSALPDKFGYSWNLQYISANNMPSEEWDSLIYDNIAKGLPVFMSGQGTGGHGFLCDGYDSQLDKYHFNWGWDGRYDGFYSMSALTPNRYNFSYFKTATIDILPFGSCAYAILSPDSTVVTIYNDDKKDHREGKFYRMSINSFDLSSIRADAEDKLKEIILDPSCVDYRPSGWLTCFRKLSNLQKITGLEYFNTSKVTNMSSMFSGCSSLESLDLSHFDTRNVTDMTAMFEDCSSLESLDLSHFDTQNLATMGWMFVDCSSLKELNLSSFNTSKVMDMSLMFTGCSSLESLDLSHFDTQNVTRMDGLFMNCYSLKQLDLSNFNTSKVTVMYNMFNDCSSLESLNVSHFDTRNVTLMYSMFSNCSSLKKLDLSSFDLTNVTNKNSFVNGCNSLKKLKVPASIDELDNSAFRSIGSVISPCEVFAPADFDFKTNTSGYYFIWKKGYFCLGKKWLLPGDVNGDEKVDITDVVKTVNYILGNVVGQFDEAAADLNGEGVIDVSDLVGIVNIILTSNGEDNTFLYCPDTHHPHMIDLGLPSGTLWSCCNVGAGNPMDVGGYFAWGETEEKKCYDWSTYIHCDGTEETYHDIGSDIAGTKYDVAHVKWGNGWQMPTEEQCKELIDYTTAEYMNSNLFKGPNGNCIYLPNSGCKYGESIRNESSGFYWTSTRAQYVGYTTSRYFFNRTDDTSPMASMSLEIGCLVRPVHK